MSLQQAGTSSSCHLPLWIERFYLDNDCEVADDAPEQLKLLPWHGRNLVWGLTQKFFGTSSYGIAGQACLLLERFLAARLRGLANMSLQNSEWERKKLELRNKILLLVAVCIQLATKMCSTHNHLNAQTLQSGLMKHHYHYSLQEINAAEVDVYQGLGFRIPLWTNVEKAHLLAKEMGLETLLETVSLIVDIAEYSRVELQVQIQSIAFETPSTSTSRDSEGRHSSPSSGLGAGNVRSMHLVAGAVAAAGRFMRHPGPDPVPRLAYYTRSPANYISCICNVILNSIIHLRDGVKRPNNMYSLANQIKRQRYC